MLLAGLSCGCTQTCALCKYVNFMPLSMLHSWRHPGGWFNEWDSRTRVWVFFKNFQVILRNGQRWPPAEDGVCYGEPPRLALHGYHHTLSLAEAKDVLVTRWLGSLCLEPFGCLPRYLFSLPVFMCSWLQLRIKAMSMDIVTLLSSVSSSSKLFNVSVTVGVPCVSPTGWWENRELRHSSA